MDKSQIALSADEQRDVEALARLIEGHIGRSWQAVQEKNRDKLADAYARAGDGAYGTYLNLLFRPVHRALKQAGLRALPPFPGEFNISREWGNADETDNQRWMWSTVTTAGKPLGTIVTIIFHDHSRFHLPRPPEIIALAETGKEEVIAALSQRSGDFRAAREASIEIAEYLALEQS